MITDQDQDTAAHQYQVMEVPKNINKEIKNIINKIIKIKNKDFFKNSIFYTFIIIFLYITSTYYHYKNITLYVHI